MIFPTESDGLDLLTVFVDLSDYLKLSIGNYIVWRQTDHRSLVCSVLNIHKLYTLNFQVF